jgi:hypothetical protein
LPFEVSVYVLPSLETVRTIASPGTPFVYVVNSVECVSMRRHDRVMLDGVPVVMNAASDAFV